MPINSEQALSPPSLSTLGERFYLSLYRIRHVENEIARIYPSDKIKSPVHLSIGQEAVSVGVCVALEPEDTVFGTYRSHALYLAKGGDLRAMMAELFGKATGCAKGKGGSMHLIDAPSGVMGASAVVGTTIANAVGFAYASRLRRPGQVVVSFFGDGAVEEGVFSESLNFAALKRLPILFVCENNFYSIFTHQDRRQAQPDISENVKRFGIPVERIDDGDVGRIHDAARRAVRSLRSGDGGPRFVECQVYRWKEHVGPNEDFDLEYRSRAEAESWFNADAVTTVADTIDPDVRDTIERYVHREVAEAIAFAESSSVPDPDELLKDVFG